MRWTFFFNTYTYVIQSSMIDDFSMFQLSKEQPFLPLRDIAAGAEADLAHISSVTRRMREGGLRTATPATSLNFSDRNKADRLAWCQLMEERGEDFWSRVVFTDEKIFKTSTPRRRYVRR